MKKQYLFISLFFLFFILSFAGCLEVERAIKVYNINEEPAEFINITEEEMNKFPTLKKAIDTNETLVTPNEEYDELADIFKDDKCFKYNNNYYGIAFINY